MNSKYFANNPESAFFSLTVVPAFHAYMSLPESDPGHHHTFIFDQAVTNIGGNYNRHTGIFTSTESGVYVFSWTVFCVDGNYFFSQLIVNSNVEGGIVCYSGLSSSISTNSASSIVVLQLNSGDVVYVRTHPTYAMDGIIFSRDSERTSFSGWKLI